MTVKEFTEYLLNNFNNDKEIVCQRWLGDADEDVYDEIDIESKYKTVIEKEDKIIIL